MIFVFSDFQVYNSEVLCAFTLYKQYTVNIHRTYSESSLANPCHSSKEGAWFSIFFKDAQQLCLFPKVHKCCLRHLDPSKRHFHWALQVNIFMVPR